MGHGRSVPGPEGASRVHDDEVEGGGPEKAPGKERRLSTHEILPIEKLPWRQGHCWCHGGGVIGCLRSGC